MRIAVLTPAQGMPLRPDQEDTFIAAHQVSAALRALGHKPVPLEYADQDVAMRLIDRFAVDLVFNLVEDPPEGPDKAHAVTRFLDDLGLAYTGAGTEALEALADKREMKARLRQAGLPVPEAPAPWHRGARYIVKSVYEHASLGLDAGSVVTGPEAAQALTEEKQVRLGGRWFAEAYVEGREFNAAMLESPGGRPTVLPIAEIRFEASVSGPRILGYREKWDAASAAYAATPRIFGSAGPDLEQRLASMAEAAWACFGLKGYARVDFRVSETGEPVILEVNANPCLTADAGFCAAAAQLGMTQTDVVAGIIDAAWI